MPLQRNQLVDNFSIYIVIASSWLDVKYKKLKCLLHFLDTYWSGTRIHHVFLHTKEATSSERRRRKEKPASARTLTPLFPETQTHKLALHISKNGAMDQRSLARNSTLSQKVLYCLFYIEELMTTHEGEQGSSTTYSIANFPKICQLHTYKHKAVHGSPGAARINVDSPAEHNTTLNGWSRSRRVPVTSRHSDQLKIHVADMEVQP